MVVFRVGFDLVIRTLMLVLAAACIASPVRAAERTPLHKMDHTPAVIHYLFNFVPRYRVADCAVRWKYEMEAGSWFDLGSARREVFGRYLLIHAPKMAEYSIDLGPREPHVEGRGQMFHDIFVFSDECERRFDVVEAMVGEFLAEYPEIIHSHVSRTPVPEEEVKGLNGRWIDTSDYDPQYWSIRAAASRDCDAAKWVEVAQDAAQSIEANAKRDGRMQKPLPVILYTTLAERLTKDPGILKAASSLSQKYDPHLSQTDRDEVVRLVDAYLATGACGKGR